MGAEPRPEEVVESAATDKIGQHRLEPIAGLEAHLVVLHREDEQEAVVFSLRAELPSAEGALGERLDRIVAEGVREVDRRPDVGATQLLDDGLDGAPLVVVEVGLRIDDVRRERRELGARHAGPAHEEHEAHEDARAAGEHDELPVYLAARSPTWERV